MDTDLEQLLSKVLAGEHASDLSPAEAAALEACLEAGGEEASLLEQALEQAEADPFLGLASLASLGITHEPLGDPAPAPSAEQWKRVEQGIWQELDAQAVEDAAEESGGADEGAPILRFPTAPEPRRNLPALLLLAAGFLLAAGLAFVIGSQGEPNPLGREGTAMVLPLEDEGSEGVDVESVKTPRPIVLEKPAAEALKVVPGPDFKAQTVVLGEDLLCVVLLEKP